MIEGPGEADRLLVGTDWDRLEVFFGPMQGWPAVPDLLETLRYGSPGDRGVALAQLDEAVPWSTRIPRRCTRFRHEETR